MRLSHLGFASILALSLPTSAWAQGEEKTDEKKAEEGDGKEEGAKEEADASATQDSGLTIRRGIFASADLGVFVTMGGTNTNDIELKSRTFSNLQPYVGLTFGYDVFNTDAFNLGLGLRLAMGLNGGAGRSFPIVNGETMNEANTRSNDYSMQQLGVAVNTMIMVAERLALTIKVDVGAGFLTPDPTIPASDPAAGGALFAPVFGAALGIELYTLLNDFSIGLQARFVGAIASGNFIPGLSGTIPIKYTF